MVKNSAFVFIKPHAVTDKTKELVTKTFEEKGISIKKEGSIEAEEIDKKMLIDQHYYAIAAKATILTPDKLDVPKEKFKDKFGVEFADCLKDGLALNAKQACEKFETSASELEALWGKCKKSGDLIKFGGGFYCAKMTSPKNEGPFYVFNGFFMSMRDKFVSPGVSIYYYVVEWESASCSWEDFRGKVLGPTDPSEAPKDSLRGAILNTWKDLGLKAEPNTGDNGVHASASPFEALAERINWLGYRAERDAFGKLLLKAGITRKQIKEWCEDPQVTFGPVPMTKSLFDSLEDTDSDYCLALCQMLGGHCSPKESSKDIEAEIASLQAQIEMYKPLADAVMLVKGYKEPKLPKAQPKKVKEEPPPPEPKRGGKGSKGKGMQEEPRNKGGGKGKGSSKGKSRDYEYYDEPPPLRQQPKGKGGGGGKGSSGSGGKGKGKSGKGKY
jgi:nucleoside diphosphate kinase